MNKIYLTLILLLATMILLIAFATSIPRDMLFYIIVGLGILVLVFLLVFYQRVMRPLQVIGNGMDLLREQDFSSRLRKVGEKKADRIVDIFNRMMNELKNAHVQLQERNHLLNLLVEVSPMGIIMLDFDEHISSMNPAAKKFLACSDEVTGKPLHVISGELAQRISILENDEDQTIHTSDAHIYHCARRSFLDRGFLHPFVLIESLTQDVMQAERTAYGKVIRMISHEVNNTMAGVGSIMETVIDSLKEYSVSSYLSQSLEQSDTSPFSDLTDALEACVSRTKDMTSFITRFANVVKIPEPRLFPTPVNQLITANQHYLESLCNAHQIKMCVYLSEENPSVQMDEALMAQVLVNIVKNCIESIREKEKDENLDALNKEETPNGVISLNTTSAAPNTISLVIADNGVGISPEASEQLFTPFFSTKKNGHGIGLLLIREILARHRCQFSLKTKDDGKTYFTIIFAQQK